MALLLEIGEVLKPDPKLVFRLIESAANKGDATGMAGGARACFYGLGVETNCVKAAALVWVEAQTSLATQYALGQGVEQDMRMASELVHQAADEGSVQR